MATTKTILKTPTSLAIVIGDFSISVNVNAILKTGSKESGISLLKNTLSSLKRTKSLPESDISLITSFVTDVFSKNELEKTVEIGTVSDSGASQQELP